jgi:hypothetical protein
MTDIKFTPGPWRADGYCVSRDSEKWQRVADCMEVADARLIAAAPELYAALKLAQTIIGHPDDDASKLIVEVLAKARGEK